MSLQAGDVVRLRSGGPPMTIGSLTKESLTKESADCYWFSSSGGFNHIPFPLAVLEKWQGDLPGSGK